MKIRVYELAEELKMPAKELIGFLNKEGIKVKNHMSALDEDTMELIKEIIDAEKAGKAKGKKKQLKIVKIKKLPNKIIILRISISPKIYSRFITIHNKIVIYLIIMTHQFSSITL